MTELLADHTTLRVGGPARRWVEATTTDELVAAVSEADAAGGPVLVLSGGSNVVVADAGFDGVVVHVATKGISDDGGSFCEIDADAAGGIGGRLIRPSTSIVMSGVTAVSVRNASSTRGTSSSSAGRCASTGSRWIPWRR